uniref:Uncharacterized protein n=1 Tax=Lepeophtheirus salmonis TaxID=72036 RepID=A0A0K2V7X1_LEPSM
MGVRKVRIIQWYMTDPLTYICVIIQLTKHHPLFCLFFFKSMQ